MTDKTLLNYIRSLNRGKHDNIVLLNLSDNVDFAKVWHTRTNIIRRSKISGPYSFYFIKNEAGLYVSTVLDMTVDLHWCTTPTYRGKGYLSKALRQTILPHIFQDRKAIDITIDKNMLTKKNAKASHNLATSLNFRLLGSPDYNVDEYRLTATGNEPRIIPKMEPITEERMLTLKGKMLDIGQELLILQTEIELSLDNIEYAEELKEVVDEITLSSNNLYDAYYDAQH